MKVNRIYDNLINTSLYKTNNLSKQNDKNIKESVNIEISNSAKTLVDKIAKSDDIGYSDRVERIRQAVLDGTYKVSPEKIADKIIQAMAEQRG